MFDESHPLLFLQKRRKCNDGQRRHDHSGTVDVLRLGQERGSAARANRGSGSSGGDSDGRGDLNARGGLGSARVGRLALEEVLDDGALAAAGADGVDKLDGDRDDDVAVDRLVALDVANVASCEPRKGSIVAFSRERNKR